MQESEIDQSHLLITTAAVQIIEKFMLEIEKSHPAFSLELQWNEKSLLVNVTKTYFQLIY